jgi:hypothetical protein
VKVGAGSFDAYASDFEHALLIETTAYYLKTAAFWIWQDSFPAYIVKIEACLQIEREMEDNYLKDSTQPKLLEIVQDEVLCWIQIRLLQEQCPKGLRNMSYPGCLVATGRHNIRHTVRPIVYTTDTSLSI